MFLKLSILDKVLWWVWIFLVNESRLFVIMIYKINVMFILNIFDRDSKFMVFIIIMIMNVNLYLVIKEVWKY